MRLRPTRYFRLFNMISRTVSTWMKVHTRSGFVPVSIPILHLPNVAIQKEYYRAAVCLPRFLRTSRETQTHDYILVFSFKQVQYQMRPLLCVLMGSFRSGLVIRAWIHAREVRNLGWFWRLRWPGLNTQPPLRALVVSLMLWPGTIIGMFTQSSRVLTDVRHRAVKL